jgi:hypothetical protein
VLTPDTFRNRIEGSNGLIVWSGQAIPATHVHVAKAGPDYLECESVPPSGNRTLIVPVGSILYFQPEEEA